MMNMWLRIRTFAALVKQSPIKSLSVKPVQKSKSLNLLNRSIKNRQIRALKSPERFVSNSSVYSICKSMNNRIQIQKHTEVRARGVQRFVRDAPRGWPTASAPPSTLVRSRGRPSSFSTAKYCAANACRQIEYCNARVHRTYLFTHSTNFGRELSTNFENTLTRIAL